MSPNSKAMERCDNRIFEALVPKKFPLINSLATDYKGLKESLLATLSNSIISDVIQDQSIFDELIDLSLRTRRRGLKTTMTTNTDEYNINP